MARTAVRMLNIVGRREARCNKIVRPDARLGRGDGKLVGLGSQLERKHKHKQAEELHREALKFGIRAVGEQHFFTAFVYSGLADCLAEQGRYALAQPLFEKALAIRRKVLGEEHPATAT